MNAHGRQGGGMVSADQRAPAVSLPPPPPQVLFCGEFAHPLGPGQRAKEGGEVDEVRQIVHRHVLIGAERYIESVVVNVGRLS